MTLPEYFGYIRALLEYFGAWNYLTLAVQASLIISLVVFLIKRFQ